MTHYFGNLSSGLRIAWEPLQALIAKYHAPPSGGTLTDEEWDRYDGLCATFQVMMAAYLEAMINFYLQMRMDADAFGDIERTETMAKWTTLQAMIAGEAAVTPGTRPHQLLTVLYSRRNVYMHHKPGIDHDGKCVHRGKTLKTASGCFTRYLEELWSLPSKLRDALIAADSKLPADAFRATLDVPSESVRAISHL